MSPTSKSPRLLVVMAHPDDTEFLVGGTLFHLKDLGWELGIVTMTAGDCGSATLGREEIARGRYAEAQNAAAYLGASYACVGMMDLEVRYSVENSRRVVEAMRRFDPDVVITQSPVDYMPDHEETSRLAWGAAFALAIPNYETRQNPPAPHARATPILYYADAIEGLDSMGRRIYPQFYVDIGACLAQKREMLSRHVSQREWMRSHHGVDEYLDRMTAWAAGYGRECGVPYAEGFRQHLGHGYPHEPIIQNALKAYVRVRGDSDKS
ncbi:MAG TPA: PIG-L family deacetylase [Terriglobia bacterium]|nr:PIG-L family deacetylase [Terriglobia bacterium]